MKKNVNKKIMVSFMSVLLILMSTILPVNPLTVKADETTDTLVKRVKDIYNHMTETEKDDVEAAREATGKLSDKDVKNILSGVGINEDVLDNDDFIDLIRDSAELVYTPGNELEDEIDRVRTEHGETFYDIFQGDLTVDEMLAFFSAFEEKLESKVNKDIMKIFLGSTSFEEKIKETINELTEEDAEFEELNGVLYQNLGIGISGIFTVKEQFEDKLGNVATQARDALLNGAIDAKLDDSDDSNDSSGDHSNGGGSSTPTDKDESDTPTTPEDATNIIVDADDVVTETTPDGSKQTKVNIDVDQITDIVNSQEEVKEITVTVPDDIDSESTMVSLPAQAFMELESKNPNATVNVSTKIGTYRLGVNEVNMDEIAASLGSSNSDNVNINIEITQSEDTDNAVVENGLESAAQVVDFKVVAVAGDKQAEVNNFSGYVSRSIPLAQMSATESTDTNKLTAVRINADGSLTPVPTVFEDGTATFLSKTNSKYTVVKNNVSFSDVSADYWAADSINKLGNKLIIHGKEDGSYAPDEATNRIQMTLLLVKSLGLTASGKYDGRFSDVEDDAWYIESLEAALEAGIVSGKEDGTFDPYAKVTRSQASVMLARAIEFTGFDEEKLDKSKTIDKFSDREKIGDWSKNDVELMIEAGIFNGRDNGTIFDPNGTTTRAQTAVVLNNYLKFIDFIN
ncbi:hypothetical protein GCM10008983_18960 [Lentibacillus halophilus]|uniref:SLH domain-containing protein n=1 Tax=Lentibacillus halophilus TaxID=295065 RepID=A0ABP3J4Y3_9BACI